MDIDLVNVQSVRAGVITEAMQGLGFQQEGRYYKHPGSQFLVESPPGPLSVGSEPVRAIDEIKLPTGTLRLISPTECVKDRLASFYHWGDLQALEQALLVGRGQTIDLAEVARWSRVEGTSQEYKEFESRLASASKGNSNRR